MLSSTNGGSLTGVIDSILTVASLSNLQPFILIKALQTLSWLSDLSIDALIITGPLVFSDLSTIDPAGGRNRSKFSMFVEVPLS